jgi:hypothetical protein
MSHALIIRLIHSYFNCSRSLSPAHRMWIIIPIKNIIFIDRKFTTTRIISWSGHWEQSQNRLIDFYKTPFIAKALFLNYRNAIIEQVGSGVTAASNLLVSLRHATISNVEIWTSPSVKEHYFLIKERCVLKCQASCLLVYWQLLNSSHLQQFVLCHTILRCTLTPRPFFRLFGRLLWPGILCSKLKNEGHNKNHISLKKILTLSGQVSSSSKLSVSCHSGSKIVSKVLYWI